MSSNNQTLESKHTPGPWIINGLYSISTKHLIICRIPDYVPEKGQEKKFNSMIAANRSLIAAAPDLLEALKYAKRRIVLLEGYTEGKCDPSDIEKINVAIAKAEGRAI
jgi:hypothetical protein